MTEEALHCPFCGFSPPYGARVCRGCQAEILYGDDPRDEHGGLGCGCFLLGGVFGALFVLDFVARRLLGLPGGANALPAWVQIVAMLLGVLLSLALARWLDGGGRRGTPRVRFVRRTHDGRREEL